MLIHLHHLLIVPDLLIRRLILVIVAFSIHIAIAVALGVHTGSTQSLLDALPESRVYIAHVLFCLFLAFLLALIFILLVIIFGLVIVFLLGCIVVVFSLIILLELFSINLGTFDSTGRGIELLYISSATDNAIFRSIVRTAVYSQPKDAR